MPARRSFWLLALATALLAASLVDERLRLPGLGLDLLVLVGIGVDIWRARKFEVVAAASWPPMLFQGQPTELLVTVSNSGAGERLLRLRHGLHPAISESPRRTELRLPPDASATWRLELTPRTRGDHLVSPLVVRLLGPMRLAWAQRELLGEEAKRVFPQVRWGGSVDRLLMLAHRRQLGTTPYADRGLGGETYALREYLPGDPLNRIQWKATARHRRPITREETWERGLRLLILLDTSRSMTPQHRGRSKLDHALAACLALARVASARGDSATLTTFSDRVEREVAVGNTAAGLQRAYGALFDVRARLTEPAYDLVARHVLAHAARGAVVLLMTSVVDMVAAEMLRDSLLSVNRRHRPILVNLLDPELQHLLDRTARSASEGFAQVSALEIRLANQRLARRLRRAGVLVMDTSADRLALDTLTSYLKSIGSRMVSRSATGSVPSAPWLATASGE